MLNEMSNEQFIKSVSIDRNKCAKNGSQFIIVSHSPILLAMPDAAIYSFDGGKIHSCAYEETESYQITQMFLENREQILGYLLDGD